MNKTTTSEMGHPRGLYLLFFTEMWERFSYYGMRAIFILFMTKALIMTNADASNIYGSFTGLVYLTPLLGGYISDKFWGNRRSILVGGIMMAIGQFLLFMSGSAVTEGVQSASSISLMWSGLTLLIVGNGFFKPNISTMVGQLYPKNDSRIDGAFTIFLLSSSRNTSSTINGSLLSRGAANSCTFISSAANKLNLAVVSGWFTDSWAIATAKATTAASAQAGRTASVVSANDRVAGAAT